MKAYLSILLALGVFFSCKKKSDDSVTPQDNTTSVTPAYKCTTCKSTPDAKVAYDNSNLGVYKGVLIGSSGTFKIVMQDGDTTATLNFDGTSLVLTKTKFDTTGGNLNATFGNGLTLLSIYVSSNGASSFVTVVIPGHPNILTQVNKEKSDIIVKSFEGTYSGSSNAAGAFNMVVVDTIVNVIWKNTNGDFGNINGTVTGKNMKGGGGNQITATGAFSDDDNVSGNWTQGIDSGTWIGKRTL